MKDHNRSIVNPASMRGLFYAPRLVASRLLLVIALLLGVATTATTVLAQATPAASPVASVASTPEASVAAAVEWLLAQQDENGAFPGFSGEADPGTTVDALLALASVPEVDEAAVEAAGSYLNGNAAEYAGFGAGQAAKLVLAAVAAGIDPTSVDGINVLDQVMNGVAADSTTGLAGSGVFDHGLAIMGLAAAGESVPTAWIDALRAVQIENGGWAFDASTTVEMADSNTTAIAIQALIAAGVAADDAAIVSGLDYLKSVVVPEGGVAYAVAEPLVADANSTGIAIQAVIAAGGDPTSAEWTDLTSTLMTFQNPSGAFFYMAGMADDNLFATVQAIPALVGVAYPLTAVE